MKGTGAHGFRRSKKPSYSGPGEYLTITPEKAPETVRRHVERYERAVGLVTNLRGVGGRWLDCACGTGYGASTIKGWGGAEEYWGIDRNPLAIQRARQDYGTRTETGGRFMIADIRGVQHWLPGLGPFDVVLSIETLEHLAYKLQAIWVSVIAHHLGPDGVMVVACPLGDDGPSTYNRFHLFEPKLGTLCQLLRSRFERVEIQTEEYVDTGGEASTQAIVSCSWPKSQGSDIYG